MGFERIWDKVIRLRMRQSTYDKLRSLLRGGESVSDLIRSGMDREIEARSSVVERKENGK